jgi:hypothetical protein
MEQRTMGRTVRLDRSEGVKVAISQSNYLPWPGYFDQINFADHFVRYDEVQYTRRDWRNRNRVKTSGGVVWISVPVVSKGRFLQRMNETEISEAGWPAKHWATLRHAYSRAAHFDEVAGEMEAALLGANEPLLSLVNSRLMDAVCAMLGIDTPTTWSTEWTSEKVDSEACAEPKTRRLLEICIALGATEYWSGPAARSYLDESAFKSHGIDVRYHDYSGYAEYPQLWGPFEPALSIVDLLFNVGLDGAREHMQSFRRP